MSGTGSSRSCRSVARSMLRAAAATTAVLALLAGCAGPPMRTGSDSRTIRIVSHKVAAGETVESIADDFYGTADAAGYLRRVNDMPADTTPDPGAVLDVPVGEEDIERYDRRTRAKVHYNRGILLAEHDDLERAADEFRESLRVDPRFADAGHNLGVVLLATGETDRAAAIFRQAVALRPEAPDYRYALAAALLEAGRPAEALEELERTLAMAPEHEDARFSRALALLELGRDDEAVFHLDAYIREFPAGRWTARARTLLREIGDSWGGRAEEEGAP